MATPAWLLPPRARQWVLTAHIVMSVGLLGDSAGFLAVSIRAAKTTDPDVVLELIRVLKMFSLVFGIPLSIGILLTGLLLGVGTRWGVFRHGWVMGKLLIVLSVMLVGGVFIGPAQTIMLEGHGDATRQLIAAASYDVVALVVATGLSVFKPGRPRRRASPTTPEASNPVEVS